MAQKTEAEVVTATEAAEAAEPAEAADSRLVNGRYRIIRELGRGASARTLLATDTETGKQVAIKELRPEHLESWKHFELFEREARVLASLRHHGVPEVFGFFEEEDEEGKLGLFLVQEFVEGTTLAERIKNGPRLSQTELIQLTTGLLDILDHLHSRTPPLFHRDIKPSNIFEVDGRLHRGTTQFGHLAHHFGNGDPIGVLYDPKDARKNCAVFK